MKVKGKKGWARQQFICHLPYGPSGWRTAQPSIPSRGDEQSWVGGEHALTSDDGEGRGQASLAAAEVDSTRICEAENGKWRGAKGE